MGRRSPAALWAAQRGGWEPTTAQALQGRLVLVLVVHLVFIRLFFFIWVLLVHVDGFYRGERGGGPPSKCCWALAGQYNSEFRGFTESTATRFGKSRRFVVIARETKSPTPKRETISAENAEKKTKILYGLGGPDSRRTRNDWSGKNRGGGCCFMDPPTPNRKADDGHRPHYGIKGVVLW